MSLLAASRGLLSGAAWADATVTYSFPDSAADYGRGYSETKKFQAFNAGEKLAFTSVVNQVAAFTDLNFVLLANAQTNNDGLAQIRIAKTVTTGADAWAYYPGAGKGGDAWFDKGLSGSYGGKGGMNWSALQPGDYSYTVFMHEFGHSLGLKHSFENGGVAGAVPKQYDSLQYTVMSYDAYQTSPYSSTVDKRDWWADNGNNPQTFMMLDIAALQEMYGADYTLNAGDNVYKWNANGAYSVNGGTTYTDLNTKTNVIFMTVWDGGGNDTFDFSAYKVGVSIDLNPGKWVTIDYANTTNPAQRADLLAGTGSYWATGNIANALLHEGNEASLIENAIGGSGADILIGNQKANVLTGGLGADAFVFNTALGGGNIDIITDFVVVDDVIWLDDACFIGMAPGAISLEAFEFGVAALEEDDRLLYDPVTGRLYYDADGSGVTAAVQFAVLDDQLNTLSYRDFLIV